VPRGQQHPAAHDREGAGQEAPGRPLAQREDGHRYREERRERGQRGGAGGAQNRLGDETEVDRQLRKGDLKFVLLGQKLSD
jgi:hypothetical protein